jgi:hypothetical protein
MRARNFIQFRSARAGTRDNDSYSDPIAHSARSAPFTIAHVYAHAVAVSITYTYAYA